jgi:hypothetical protein
MAQSAEFYKRHSRYRQKLKRGTVQGPVRGNLQRGTVQGSVRENLQRHNYYRWNYREAQYMSRLTGIYKGHSTCLGPQKYTRGTVHGLGPAYVRPPYAPVIGPILISLDVAIVNAASSRCF